MRAPLLLALTLWSCSSPSSAPVSSDASSPLQAQRAPAPAPSLEPQQAPPVIPARPQKSKVAAPKNGCAPRAEQGLAQAEHALSLHLADQPAVLSFEATPPTCTLWLTDAGGTFSRGPQQRLEAKVLYASAACDATHCELALVDERARLLAASADKSGMSQPVELASGVDRRFAPAIALDGARTHYAYTRSVDEAMHTFWITRSGRVSAAAVDLTPAGHGAAAATFMLGSERPTLVFIDAHAGISPLLELTFDRAGRPGEAVVRTPVSQPYAPPLLSAVAWPHGEAEVFFSVVGRMAMTAIARVPLRKAAEPSALLPSKGYGALSFSAARGPRRALFALEVPAASTPNAPRTLALKLLDGARTDDVLALAGDARRPSVSHGATAGDYLLSYVRDQVVQAQLLHCDD